MDPRLIAENLVLVFARSGEMVVRLFPYVLLGVVIGELLKLARWVGLIEGACRRHPLPAIASAAVLGVVSPLCTYGTIPIVLQLRKTGTPVAPLISFLAASSLMNPQLLVITWRGIGAEMALARLLTVLIYAVILGLVLWRIPPARLINPRVVERNDSAIEKRGSARSTWRGVLRGTWRTLRFVSFYMIIGILLGSAIEVFVPSAWILRLFDPGEWFALPLAAVLGVPLYACGGGTIPLIRSLLLGGMGKGSALAFFLVGAATRPTPLVALKTVLRGGVVVGYVCSLILFAILSGWLFEML